MKPGPHDEFGTSATSFAEGGPFSCMDCVHRTPHSKDKTGKLVDSCSHPLVMKDPQLKHKKLPDGTIEVDHDDCCKFVWPNEAKSGLRAIKDIS
jgi:hypothetical protein